MAEGETDGTRLIRAAVVDAVDFPLDQRRGLVIGGGGLLPCPVLFGITFLRPRLVFAGFQGPCGVTALIMRDAMTRRLTGASAICLAAPWPPFSASSTGPTIT